MRLKIHQQEQKLDQLFKLTEKIEDDEIKANMSKFLCVRISGFIETSLKNLVNEFVDGTSPKQVQDYVNKKIKNATNLKYDKLLGVLDLFSKDWREKFENLITDEQKAALNSIVSNRNNISHGETDTISYELIKAYYIHAKAIVEHLKIVIKK